MRMLILSYTNKWSYPMFVPNSEILGAVVAKTTLTQILLCITLECEMEKKKNVKGSQIHKIFQPSEGVYKI